VGQAVKCVTSAGDGFWLDIARADEVGGWPEDFVEPAPASDEDVLLVHTPEYVHKLRTGTLSESEAWKLDV